MVLVWPRCGRCRGPVQVRRPLLCYGVSKRGLLFHVKMSQSRCYAASQPRQLSIPSRGRFKRLSSGTPSNDFSGDSSRPGFTKIEPRPRASLPQPTTRARFLIFFLSSPYFNINEGECVGGGSFEGVFKGKARVVVAVVVVAVCREVEGVHEGSECDGVDGEAWQQRRGLWSGWRGDGKVEEQESNWYSAVTQAITKRQDPRPLTPFQGKHNSKSLLYTRDLPTPSLSLSFCEARKRCFVYSTEEGATPQIIPYICRRAACQHVEERLPGVAEFVGPSPTPAPRPARAGRSLHARQEGRKASLGNSFCLTSATSTRGETVNGMCGGLDTAARPSSPLHFAYRYVAAAAWA
ncbi:hypothetical protein E2C01_010594 [Portunus trituberculatus]|uniref:Uncharacterized protein n=1 Tax=Portunus trituberculatus TaxID=210409 RepID=A0A5B7D931_PORTR|nr:hypothetical protein [Portunus trituberculatus]